MSKVTSVILIADCDVAEEIESVNRFLEGHKQGGGGRFIDVTDHAGGYKDIGGSVHLSAFNHADTTVILEAVEQAMWRDRESVQVFVREEHELAFRLRWVGQNLSGNVSVELTPEDLEIIRNALSVVCFELDLHNEFESRIGSNVNRVSALIARLASH